MSFDVFWCLLMFFDVFWCLSISFNAFRCLSKLFDVFWCRNDVSQCLLMCFAVFWCQTMSFDVFQFKNIQESSVKLQKVTINCNCCPSSLRWQDTVHFRSFSISKRYPIAVSGQSSKSTVWTRAKGTSINDVRCFSAIFDLPIYHVRPFLPYKVRYLRAFLDSPIYPKIGRHLWTFPNCIA